jgi:NAD-dependent dihydropyrimidine dehydrogenase PreA subunit
MINSAAPAPRVVLYEGAGSQPLEPARRNDILRGLLEKGYAVTVVRPGGSVSDAPESGTLLVLGQFAGGTAPQFGNGRQNGNGNGHAHGDALLKVEARDISAAPDAAAVLLPVESLVGETGTRKPGGWKPWFPVIDYQRCTNCMQCLSFCLFDVYGVSNQGKIQVQNENNCKTDCPACSRVCPEVAILFPKYRFGPINGDEINPEDLRREAMKVDISALLGGDIYQALRDRSAKAKSRFSKERDDERALAERNRCLQKLQQSMSGMEIPPEVLASLPSADEIKAKAEQARARAEAAIRAQPANGGAA